MCLYKRKVWGVLKHYKNVLYLSVYKCGYIIWYIVYIWENVFSVTNDAMPQVEYFSISSSTQDDGAIRDFIENDEITILAATDTDQTVCFQHRLPTEETCLLFYKIPQLRTPPTNVPGDVPVGILTLEGGLVKSIYNSVLRVYSPHVTKVRHFEVGIIV